MAAAMLLWAPEANAQAFLNKLKEKAGQAIGNAISERMGEKATDSAADKMPETIGIDIHSMDGGSNSEFPISDSKEALQPKRSSSFGWDGVVIPSKAEFPIPLMNEFPAVPSAAKLANPTEEDQIVFYKAIKAALAHEGIEIQGLYFDILLAGYLLDSTLNNNAEQIMHYFGADITSTKDDGLSLFNNSNPERTAKLAFYSKKFANKIFSELEQLQCRKLYEEVDIPLASVLAEMEIEGFPIHADVLENMGENFKVNLKNISAKIFEMAGEKFNIDSPKQVGEILYNKLQLPLQDKKASTSVDALKNLLDKHPIVSEILLYRKYSKLLSTYVDGLISHIHADGKLHAIFNQALTQTGRLSSSEPNLQNISVRDEEGKMIRKAFYYDDENYSILSLDYSQIELRILASLSGCKPLQKVFESGEDIHSATARRVFHSENPTALERRRAKAVNFGIIYGISDFGLAEQIDCSRKEAKEIISSFYEAYPEISEYFRKVSEEVNEKTYVSTLLGRRRYLREIHDTNYQVREFARRAAMNAPIQGTAADLIKIAMIKVNQALKDNKLESKIICQIHDELLIKVPNNEKEKVYDLVKNIMENAMKLDVKLEVDGGYGRTWYDAK